MSTHAHLPAHRRRPTPGPVGGSLRDLAKRVPALKAMALEPIGDIADASLTDNTVGAETLTWSTATDWDNAVSEYGVEHASGTINLIKVTDDHNDGSYDTSKWTDKSFGNANMTEHDGYLDYNHGPNQADRPYNVSAKTHFDTPNGSKVLIRADYLQGDQFKFVPWWDGEGTGTYNTPDDGVEVDVGAIRKIEGGTQTDLSNSGFSSKTTDMKVIISGTYADFDVEAYTGGTLDDSVTGQSATFSTNPQFCGWYGRETGTESHADNHEVLSGEGFLETATKSFSSSTKPDLQNLTYSLNGGSCDLVVVGSPSGSTETVTQTLDGTTSFDLSWTNAHTNFRVRVKPTAPDFGSEPTVSQVELTTP